MAEVIGVIASTIALCQACELTFKGFQFVKEAKQAQEEFIDTRNEITTVSAFLNEALRIVDTVSAPDCPDSSSTLNVFLVSIVTILSELKKELEELNNMLLSLQARDRPTSTQHGVPNISRIKWAKKASAIRAMRSRINQRRQEFTSALALVSNQSSRRHTELLVEVKTAFTARFDTLHDIYESLATRQTETIESINELKGSVMSQGQELKAFGESHQSTQHRVQGTSTQTVGTIHNDGEMGSEYTALRLKSLKQCSDTCKCRCHRRTATRTPRILCSIVGQLLLSHNMIPTWNTVSCNSKTCASSSDTRSVQMTYIFPQWMLRKAVSLHLSMGSLTNAGASLHLAIPRVIPRNHPGWTAIRFGNIDHLQHQISSKTLLPTDIDEMGQSLLLYSLRQWPPTVFEFMLELCPKPAFWWKDSYGRSVVSHAYSSVALGHLSGDSSVVTKVKRLAPGTYISTTIIDVVAGRVNFDIGLQNAIDIGPGSINSRDTGGFTAVHWAVTKRDSRSLNVLVANGADINIADFEGWTPLHHAVALGEVKTVRYLIEAGSNLNAVNSWHDSPLHLAARGHYHSIVKLLLSNGAQPKLLNLHERTPLFMPLNLPDNTALIPILRELQNAGNDLNHGDCEKRTPLHIAVELNNIAMIRALHDLQADFEAKDCWGQTFLHFVALTGRLATIKTLRELEVCCKEYNVRNASGYTAMDLFRRRVEESSLARMADQSAPLPEEIRSFCSLMSEVQARSHRPEEIEGIWNKTTSEDPENIDIMVPFKEIECELLAITPIDAADTGNSNDAVQAAQLSASEGYDPAVVVSQRTALGGIL